MCVGESGMTRFAIVALGQTGAADPGRRMHIKSITLKGFKSYQDSTIFLDRHHNVVGECVPAGELCSARAAGQGWLTFTNFS